MTVRVEQKSEYQFNFYFKTHHIETGDEYEHFRVVVDVFSSRDSAVFEQAGAELNYCDGLYYPSTIDRVYPAPPDMQPDYRLPNYDDLKDKPLIIYNVMPESDSEGEITWNEIEDYYNTSGKDFQQVMDSNIDNYVAKGTINENNYTIGEINNYYTDVNYDEKVETVDPPTGLPAPVPDSEIAPVSSVDRSLLQVAKESYQYLADTVKTSIDGLTTITAGAAGLITFLSTTMSWLPDEWVVMFSAAFGLGLFAFFFRR